MYDISCMYIVSYMCGYVWYIMYIMMYIIVGLWCSCLMVLCRCIVLCWYNFILYLGMWSCLLLCVQMVLFRPDFCVIKVCYNFCVTFVYYFVVVCYPIFTAVFRYKVECISIILLHFCGASGDISLWYDFVLQSCNRIFCWKFNKTNRINR